MSGETVERLAGLEEAREPWTRLDGAHDNVFGTWEWAYAWWASRARPQPPLVYVVRDQGNTVVALLPLYAALDRGVGVLRFIGHGVGDQLGPVCAPRHRTLAARALDDLVRRHLGPRWVLLAEGLRADEEWRVHLGGRLVRADSFPVLTLDGDSWDGWLAAKSGHFRRSARRFERALVRDHGLTFQLVATPAELPAAIETLIALHRARWGARSGVFEGPVRRAFYTRMLPRALECGWLRLWLAIADGRPVAAWLGFRYAGTEAYYQGGRDPAWDHTSVGLVLLLHTIREALADGMREYRFLRGDEPYKRRLLSADPRVETVAVGAGLLPWALVAQEHAKERARAARVRLRGRG